MNRQQAAFDVATLIARLDQIDREGRPDHWLWERVMTCDVPRLLLAVEELVDAAQRLLDQELDGYEPRASR